MSGVTCTAPPPLGAPAMPTSVVQYTHPPPAVMLAIGDCCPVASVPTTPPPIGMELIVFACMSNQQTFVASTATDCGIINPATSTVGVPPAIGTFMIEPLMGPIDAQ